jgi:hypothetical protein
MTESKWVWAVGAYAFAFILALGLMVIIRAGARDVPTDLRPAPEVRGVVATQSPMPAAGPSGVVDGLGGAPPYGTR